MKNFSNTEILVNIKNNELSFSNNNDSFNSFEFYSQKNNILKKKRTRIYSGKNIYSKMNKIQKSQNITNKKLDLLISLFKSKLLGEYDYNISHYDLFIKSNINANINNSEIIKKKNIEFNIKDEFGPISSFKKELSSISSSSNNVYRKRIHRAYDNKLNNRKDFKYNSNVKGIINDYLSLNKSEKNNNGDYEKKNINNNDYEDFGNNEDFDNKINNEELDIKSKLRSGDQITIKNMKIFEENNNINSLLLNNTNKSFKNEINLNKYKFEEYNNNSNEIKINNINKIINDININDLNSMNIINNEIKDTNNYEKNDPQYDLGPSMKNIQHDKNIKDENNIVENEKIENININQEINKIENNGNNINNIKNEDEKDSERKLDSSQSDSMSIKSNSSPKKSNQGSSRKIRGFNFRNKIKIKNYNGNKFEPSSSNNNQKK